MPELAGGPLILFLLSSREGTKRTGSLRARELWERERKQLKRNDTGESMPQKCMAQKIMGVSVQMKSVTKLDTLKFPKHDERASRLGPCVTNVYLVLFCLLAK